MLYNILTTAADKTRAVSVGEAALYALLGFLTVFIGIALLIFIVWLVGKIMTKATSLQKKDGAQPIVSQPITEEEQDEVSEETVAAITAAIMAYYQEERRQCEFRVKRIKKV